MASEAQWGLDEFDAFAQIYNGVTHMSVEMMPPGERLADLFSHIDMGFLNRRLALTALGPLRTDFMAMQIPGDDHMTRLSNDHLLVTMLLDIYSQIDVPTLAEALALGKPTVVTLSIERLEPCPEIYTAPHVAQHVHFDFDPPKPVMLSYHTNHIVSDTGREALAAGYKEGHREAILARLHDNGARFTAEPVVMGAPWLDHPRNEGGWRMVWHGQDYGEILPEDIEEFAKLKAVIVANADEWMLAMKRIPEARVKEAIASLLNEPTKKDWGGEENDHFSANVTVGGRRRTAAFLLKGPTRFEEMTPSMCGKQGDQIYRLDKAHADISVVQHSHLIGPAVRETVRAFTVTPGSRSRKFCIMDGQATYRLLKAYGFLEAATSDIGS